TFARLFAAAGTDWPTGTNLSTPEIDAAEKAANEATEAYVRTGCKGAREALQKWEYLMMLAIRATKLARGCCVCGIEKVVEVVDRDGHRSCGRCRAGNVKVGG
ncbi:MAG TPA: hypothetical protein VIV60_04450, partial [Polyangiaceae bacterium]